MFICFLLLREKGERRERDQNAFIKIRPNSEYEIIFDI